MARRNRGCDFVLIAGIIFIFLGLIGISKHLRIRRNGVTVTAVVSEIKPSTGRHKYDNVYMTFRTEEGAAATGRTDETADEFHVGDSAEIIYMRHNPAKIYTSSGGLSGYVVLLIGIALLLIHKLF